MPENYLEEVKSDLNYIKEKLDDVNDILEMRLPNSFAKLGEHWVASLLVDMNSLRVLVGASRAFLDGVFDAYYNTGEGEPEDG